VDGTATPPERPVTEDRAIESDDALIVYTSGTTGRPKGVLLDHHRAIWAALAQIVSLGIRDGDRYLHLPPLYHAGGVVFLNAVTLVGGTHVLIPAFEPAAVLEAVERERITCLLGVPTMYQFLLRHPDLSARDLSSWRIGVFGAAPMPAPAVEALLKELPGVEFFQQCGQTEAGPTGIYSTTAQIRDRPDSSGHLAQPFVEARLVHEDGTDVVPVGVGELVIRGEPVMKGYWNQPEATAEALRDGWLYTGDLVELTEDGAMRLVDRLKDVIITGGRNVYSAEVEQALAGHPDVADCAVVGRPDPDWGSTVVALVTPRAGTAPTLDALREHCRPLIADYKLPRELVLGPVPRNPGGKVQKNVVRARFGR
jgi:fatty-acyl-CoA synthase